MTRKYSKKREAILEMLGSTTTHPSAEWIYHQLKGQYPDLSLGTVYRNLALFKQEGQVQCVATVEGQERYDADTSTHSHFICSSCGAVLDVEGVSHSIPDEVIENVGKETGGLVDGFRLDFYGLCHDCGFHRA